MSFRNVLDGGGGFEREAQIRAHGVVPNFVGISVLEAVMVTDFISLDRTLEHIGSTDCYAAD